MVALTSYEPLAFTPRCRKDPEVLTHLMAENNYTAAVMAPTQGLQDALYEEMKARIPPEETYPAQVRPRSTWHG